MIVLRLNSYEINLRENVVTISHTRRLGKMQQTDLNKHRPILVICHFSRKKTSTLNRSVLAGGDLKCKNEFSPRSA